MFQWFSTSGRYFFVILFDAFKKWQRDELNNADFFRELLQYLEYWPQPNGGRKKTSSLHLLLARSTLLLALLATAILFPYNAYLFQYDNFFDCVQALDTIFVAGMITLIAGCLLFRVDTFEDAATALSVMADAVGHHFVKPSAILLQNRKLADTIMFYYWFLTLVVFPAVAIGVPIMSLNSRKFLIRSWYPYDFKQSPAFELTICVWVAAAIISLHLVVVFNAFLMTLLAEGIKHLQILNYNLSRIIQLAREDVTRPKPEWNQESEKISNPCREVVKTQVTIDYHLGKKVDSNVTKKVTLEGRNELKHNQDVVDGKPPRNVIGCEELNRRVEAKFKACLVLHQLIISYVKTIQKAADYVLMMQFACSVCPAMTAILFVLSEPEFDTKVVVFVTFIIMCLLDQAVFCWLAERIAEESSLVRNSVFGSDWFGQSDDFKQSMRIMISRSNQPIIIKVAGFVPMTMESFHSVLKLIVSYYMSLTAALGHNTIDK